MIDEHKLARRVAESFRAHAEWVTVDDEPFDPTRRLAPSTPDVGPRRGRVLLLAAAITAVAGIGAATWLIRDHESDTVINTPVVPPAPTDGLAPTWVPDGWTATDARWGDELRSSPFVGDAFIGDALALGDRAQLFGDPGDPTRAVLIEIGGGVVGEAFPDGEDVTVRGEPGAAQTTDQVIELRFRPEGVAFVEWTEDGVALRASYRGLSLDQAVAVVDGLRPRADDLGAGFDLGADDGGLQLLEEVLEPASPESGRTEVGLVYEPAAPAADGPFLVVMTTSGGGAPTVGYLHSWFSGDVSADGVARAWDPRGWYKLTRPDGAAVDVALQGPELGTDGVTTVEIPDVGSALEVTRRVADGVRRVAPGDLADLARSAHVAAVDMPLLATAELDAGTVEVRGRGRAEAVCLTVGADARCTGRDEAFEIDGVLAAQVEIDDGLYAIGVSHQAPPTIRVGDQGTPVAAETAAVAGWHIALAAVPADEPVTVD